MHIFIDFDYTLFDTHALRSALSAALLPAGVTPIQYERAEKNITAHALYSLEAHMQELANMISEADGPTLLQLAQEVLRDTSPFLYNDAVDFMQRHQSLPTTVLSFGNEAWQRIKIEHSGIVLNNVTTQPTSVPKVEYIQQWLESQPAVESAHNAHRAVFINDRGSEIDALHNAVEGVVSIWVRRSGTPYEQESCEHATYEVTDLSFDIDTLIN